VDEKLLRSAMVKHGDTQSDLAEAMGISLSRLNAKINNNGAEFKQTEIMFIKQRYKLTAKEVNEIFFNPKVS